MEKYPQGRHPNSLANLSGRKKGQKNKFTTLKQAFLNAFVNMGGEGELKTWAKDNPTEFYRLVAKLLPRQVDIGVSLEEVIGALPTELGDAAREQFVSALSDGGDQKAR